MRSFHVDKCNRSVINPVRIATADTRKYQNAYFVATTNRHRHHFFHDGDGWNQIFQCTIYRGFSDIFSCWMWTFKFRFQLKKETIEFLVVAVMWIDFFFFTIPTAILTTNCGFRKWINSNKCIAYAFQNYWWRIWKCWWNELVFFFSRLN